MADFDEKDLNENNEDKQEIRSAGEGTGTGDKPESGDKKESDYEDVCFICRRPESKAGKMISMPGGISMCHDCMQKAFDALNQNGMDFGKLSNMPFLNMNIGDISNLMKADVSIPQKQKIKKKTAAPKTYTIRDIPAPHLIKQRLDE